jgi:hypothetical protein
MPSDLMSKCEQKKMFKIEGKYIQKWVEVEVSRLPSGEQPDIRCLYCHGKVRVHRQQVEHGPRDHVEHRTRQDSENCKGGHYFNGDHKISLQPVE